MLQKPKQLIVPVCVLFILWIGELFPAHGQDYSSAKVNETLFDLETFTAKLYGTNDVVVNGRKYIPTHYNAKGNPYFLTDNWMKGSLVIDGKKHDNQELLYNIDIEKVILKTTINSTDTIYLVLNSEFIEAFYLGGRYFVNASQTNFKKQFQGFLEQVYSGRFMVMTRHQKSFVSSYSKNSPNGFYSATTSVHYILNNGQISRVSTKKSLFNYFSAHKRDIKNYLHRNKIKYKQADALQLTKLFEYCDEISYK
jgi:hypothetical protein